MQFPMQKSPSPNAFPNAPFNTSTTERRINYTVLVPNAYGKERMAAEWVAWPNKETALTAILLGLLFHWLAMTWFLGMDIRLRLGRERLESVVSEPRSSECSCCLTKSGTWFNPPPTLFIAQILGPWQNRGRISCMQRVAAYPLF
jgi:hypothetical protein